MLAMRSAGYFFVLILMIASKGLGSSIPQQDAGATRRTWPVVPGPWPSQSQGNVDSNLLPPLYSLSGYGSVPSSVGVSSIGFGSTSDSLAIPSLTFGSSVQSAGMPPLPQYISSSQPLGLPPIGFGTPSNSLGFPRYGLGSVHSHALSLPSVRYGAKYVTPHYGYGSSLSLPSLPPLPLSSSLQPLRISTLYDPQTVSDSSSVYDSLSSSSGSAYLPYSSSISSPLLSSDTFSSNTLIKGCYPPTIVSSLCNLSELTKRLSDKNNAAASSMQFGFGQED